MRKPSVQPVKRPYTRPTLVTYGDVLLVTKGRVVGGRGDGGKGMKSRTR